MDEKLATDTAAQSRQARYGSLPERIRYEDMTEEVRTDPVGGIASHDPEGAWKYSTSCLALDLGL